MMATNLTGSKIKDTFAQLLHVDGGPEATEKAVLSAVGVPTALKVGTGSASVENIRLDGNTVSTLNENGDMNLTPNGTGAVVITKLAVADAAQARTALGLGSAALDDTGDFATAAQGLLADSALQPGDPISVAFGNVTGRAHGIFYDLSDQTFTAATPTSVEFDTTGLAVGVSVVSNTRITFAAAGVYEIASRLQFLNTINTDFIADVWFRLDGTDIPNSASELVIPKSSTGGVMSHAITGILQVTAGQYLEVVIAVQDAGVELHYVADQPTPYARPSVPSAILVANRIA
jgi:hypothetical protein